MPMPISKKAEKYLGQSKHYEAIPGNLPADLEDIFVLESEDGCIGLYRNEGHEADLILITNKGLQLRAEGKTTSVQYTNIANIASAPKPDFKTLELLRNADQKTKATAAEGSLELVLNLTNGSVVKVPVRGKTPSEFGQTSDISGFQSFLHSVMAMLKQQ